MHVLDRPVCQKQTQTFKNLVSWFLPREDCQSTLLHWGSKCPLWMAKKMKTGFVEESFLDPSPGKYCLWRGSWQSTASPCWIVHRTQPPVTSIYWQRTNWNWKCQDLRVWDRSKQKHRRLSTSWQKKTLSAQLTRVENLIGAVQK